jgi:hypothetical protein
VLAAPLAGYGTPDADENLVPLNVHSAAYEIGRQVKTGPGYLFGFTAYSSNVAAQWIQVFDCVGSPASGAVPVAAFKVAAASHLYQNWVPARTFLVGCWIGNSTTGPTYTAGAADTFFDVQFL